MPFSYGDLPDTIRTKPFWPLSRVLWLGYTQLGYDAFEKALPIIPEVAYDFIKIRLDEAIMTEQDCIKGILQSPERTMAYLLFPPITTVRTDLQQGLSKLLYGDSIDICVVTPKMTLECSPPNLRKKETYQKEEFEWKFPEGNRVNPELLEMSLEEFLDGVLLDITPEFPLDGEITKDLIISKGIGRKTAFVK